MGSASSKMSADPCATHETLSEAQAGNGTSAESSAPDVAALRAAVLKSAMQKRRTVKSSATDKEDGEVSEGDDGKMAAASTTPSTSTVAKSSRSVTLKPERPPTQSAKATSLSTEQIRRSTVVTISNSTGELKRQTLPISGGKDMTKEDEKQYLEIIRNLLHDGVKPETLIDNGAPSDLVTRVCEEIVAGSKSRKSLWLQTRSPLREEDSEPPSTAAVSCVDSSQPTSSEIPSPSSSIEVAVHSVRQSSESESENEAAVERLTAPSANSTRPSIPRIIPTSSWTPSQGSTFGGALRIESYRPSSRSSSMMSTPIAPAPLFPSPLSTLPQLTGTIRPPPPPLGSFPPPPPPHPPKRKRHRDYDSVNEQSTFLNYGDEDTPSSASTVSHANGAPTPHAGRQDSVVTATDGAPSRPAPAPLAVPSQDAASSSAASSPSAAASAPTVDLAEVRRKALESMRASMKKKKVAAVLPPSSSAQAIAAEEAAKLEREVTGSSAEVPMDIDEDEVEEGEISDSPPVDSTASTPVPSAISTPPIVVTSTSLRRTTSARGIKRPLAEDLNDNSGRPKSVARVMLNRRTFGAPQRSSRLVLCLDDDSDSDSGSDEESQQPTINIPRIEIPSPFPEPDTAALLAEKAESIRKLKEQIAARMLAKKSSRSTPEASMPGSPAPTEGVRRLEEAAAAAQNVGVEGLATDVVEAAVLAAAEEQDSSDKAGAQRKGKGKGKGKAVDRDLATPSTAEIAQQGADDIVMDNADNTDDIETPQDIADQPVGHSHGSFRAYRPLLPSYPQLAAYSHDLLPQDNEPRTLDVDWSLVSSIILTCRLQKDPTASICRSEAAGGSCADPACEDVHILRSEPTDDDILTYATRLVALQGSNVSKSVNRADAVKQAKAELVAKTAAAMDTDDGNEARWANAENLTALVGLTAQRLRAR